MKKKLLMVILFCLGIAGVTWAGSVINVDLNAAGNNLAYEGVGVYDTNGIRYDDSISTWLVYSGGYGLPIYSPGATNLLPYNEPNIAGVYASQLWIADGATHSTYQDPNITNTLMNDGFIKTGGTDPNISLWGRVKEFEAYGGTFDIYVYGARPGSYTLYRYNSTFELDSNNLDSNITPGDPNTYRVITTSQGWVSAGTKTVDGGFDGDFVEDEDYVVFPAVDINAPNVRLNTDDGNDVNNTVQITDGNHAKVYLTYSNVINGLQLVNNREPIAIQKTGVIIPAGRFDAAGEVPRDGEYEDQYSQGSSFGPDISGGGADGNFPGPYVGMLNPREYMEYEVTVDDANAGQYAISIIEVPWSGESADKITIFGLYLDSYKLGSVTRQLGTAEARQLPPLSANLLPGTHTIKWELSADTNATGDSVYDVNIFYLGDVNIPDCNAVTQYRLNYTSDLNKDCYVDYKDLDIMTEQWLLCDDPNANNCL